MKLQRGRPPVKFAAFSLNGFDGAAWTALTSRNPAAGAMPRGIARLAPIRIPGSRKERKCRTS